MATGRLFLMRHGETLFNAEGRYQGQRDAPLSARGLAQAEAVSSALAAEVPGQNVRLICSPLGRVQQSVEVLLRHLPADTAQRIDPRLKELSMGAFEGKNRAEIAIHWPDIRRGLAKREWMFHAPGGESLDAFTKRVSDALNDIRETQKAAPGTAQIIVSHAMTGRILRGLHSGLPMLHALALDARQEDAYELCARGDVRTITAC